MRASSLRRSRFCSARSLAFCFHGWRLCLSLDCWLIRHPLVKARHPGRWTLWNPADQDSEAQEDMHHEIELGPRPKRELGDEVHILGKKIEPFWPFLGCLQLSL